MLEDPGSSPTGALAEQLEGAVAAQLAEFGLVPDAIDEKAFSAFLKAFRAKATRLITAYGWELSGEPEATDEPEPT